MLILGRKMGVGMLFSYKISFKMYLYIDIVVELVHDISVCCIMNRLTHGQTCLYLAKTRSEFFCLDVMLYYELESKLFKNLSCLGLFTFENILKDKNIH